ncbi:MAG TPA: hypothetical protein VKP67_10150, partial [Xanthobacteraceae bacterium]|nr:hypothetical protein [Xanthobacteraceae bacterium]
MRHRDIFDASAAPSRRKLTPMWGGRLFVVAQAIVIGLSFVSSGAPAQTVLPDINVIAPSPLPAR